MWVSVCVKAFLGSPSASLLRRRKSRRVPPSGPRLRRPAKEGPRRAAVFLLPFGPGRAASGGFRFDFLSQRKRPAIHGRPPAGFFHSPPSPTATGPEGGTRRLLRHRTKANRDAEGEPAPNNNEARISA